VADRGTIGNLDAEKKALVAKNWPYLLYLSSLGQLGLNSGSRAGKLEKNQ